MTESLILKPATYIKVGSRLALARNRSNLLYEENKDNKYENNSYDWQHCYKHAKKPQIIINGARTISTVFGKVNERPLHNRVESKGKYCFKGNLSLSFKALPRLKCADGYPEF